MDLVSFVPSVGATASFTPGSSTPAPYNVSHIGLTDGVSPATASLNQAEIYNRILLQIASAIAGSGLTVDNNNWAQLGQAMAAYAATSYGTTQTWMDVLVTSPGPRALTTPYPNGTGRPITVCFDLASGSFSSQQNALIMVGGVQIGQTMGVRNISGGDTSLNMTGTFVVPAGASYQVNLNNGTATINSWFELR